MQACPDSQVGVVSTALTWEPRAYSPVAQLLSAGNAPTILNRRDNMEMPDAQIDRTGLCSAENVRHYG
jgi:hypothetical protein